MKHLHVIAFDIPYPANYGGAIDVFYRLKALHKAGVKIILHCWHKDDRTEQSALNSICEKVYYYHRNMSFSNQLHTIPFAVLSRKSEQLIANLLKDDYPILFEGLVSCYYMQDKRLNNRIKLFRECNVEHDYYRELAKASSNLYHKIYYYVESIKLKHYEKVLRSANHILTLSHNDEQHFRTTFPQQSVIYLPCAHANQTISIKAGLGDYIFYHGNLELAENEKAVRYLCEHVFAHLSRVRCIVAGRKPSNDLIKFIHQWNNIELYHDIDDTAMHQLVVNAQIHVLITFQNTGLKLKLLNTAFAGRHMVVNSAMVDGSGVEELCHVGNTANEQIQLCKQLISQTFTFDSIKEREELLNSTFSNKNQASIILSII